MPSYYSIPSRTYGVSHPANTRHWQATWCPNSYLLNSAFLKGGNAPTPCAPVHLTSTCRLQYPCASTSSCSSPRCCWRCHGWRQAPRLLHPRKVGDACGRVNILACMHVREPMRSISSPEPHRPPEENDGFGCMKVLQVACMPRRALLHDREPWWDCMGGGHAAPEPETLVVMEPVEEIPADEPGDGGELQNLSCAAPFFSGYNSRATAIQVAYL
jgi:hypothetical protein